MELEFPVGIFSATILLGGLLAALVQESRGRGFACVMSAVLTLALAVTSTLERGPQEALWTAAGFLAGTGAAMALVLAGKLKMRHALLCGMATAALGPGALPTMAAFACMVWGGVLTLGFMERACSRKRLFKAVYCSRRFVLAGPDADELMYEERKLFEGAACQAISTGAALAMFWHVTGHGYLAAF